MGELRLDGVTKIYDDAQGTETAVDSIELTVQDGEFVVLVGPSGCGKSTTLRMLAGLETVTDGTIEIGSNEVQELAPSKRSVAMVFQSYALYTKMTARENMGYGLKHSSGLSKAERQEKVEEIAELLDITELLADKPEEMSGGQKQRVALGRAIVRDPDVFLLDEPLSNLDAKLRSRMRTELQRLQSDLDVTTVYVTHDQTEAMTMADRIVVMNDGELQQVAPPETAYDHPVNEFVATFLGSPAMNTFETTVRVDGETASLVKDGTVYAEVPSDSVSLSNGDRVTLGIRPEDVTLDTDGDGTFTATVTVSEYQGNDNFVHLQSDGIELTTRVPPAVYPDAGDEVGVSVRPEDVYLFDIESGNSIKTRGTSTDKPSIRTPSSTN
ncbi:MULTISPECIES: ABC transporter ATP-binding protein [Haloferax]|uniref:ABC-type D-xylose/L-arabinose transporter n=2 Tax=Haloferax TaxID=2251 RepID=A0A6G1Z670_9EURY|nr:MULTISPECIES: sn-glycerol-3-phosphate ABC transporter ATP-binding protein UgpC [Haloferax]KAB1185415.1 sn-glycerol-3-phosphate ABC transporter ATP-binding protein UgpC [Haloferax sp. CBA1149]MRW82059.1 sn-glycerol-3-phosphate ABC transporter ATP-binding protein UgpC [Haloferax marinisediminis]